MKSFPLLCNTAKLRNLILSSLILCPSILYCFFTPAHLKMHYCTDYKAPWIKNFSRKRRTLSCQRDRLYGRSEHLDFYVNLTPLKPYFTRYCCNQSYTNLLKIDVNTWIITLPWCNKDTDWYHKMKWIDCCCFFHEKIFRHRKRLQSQIDKSSKHLRKVYQKILSIKGP